RHAELGLELVEELEDLRLDRDVQRRRRLVGDEEVGVARQRHGDHHALPHPARELVRVLLRPALGVRNVDELQHLDGLVHRVSPRLMWKSIPSTARTTPSSVKKYVFSPLTSSSRSAMTPPLARYHNWLASDGGAWITDSPRLWLRLALPGSQTRLAARVAEPP